MLQKDTYCIVKDALLHRNMWHIIFRYKLLALALHLQRNLPCHVLYGVCRIIKEHARTGIAHHLAYMLALFGLVAVHLAQTACRLVVLKRTTGKARRGIFKQFAALRTQLPVALLMAAIQAYHQFHGVQLVGCSRGEWHCWGMGIMGVV